MKLFETVKNWWGGKSKYAFNNVTTKQPQPAPARVTQETEFARRTRDGFYCG